MPAWEYRGAVALLSLVLGRVSAGMAQGSLCCLSQQPLTGGTGQGKKKKKKEVWVQRGIALYLHSFKRKFPENYSFL